MPRRLYIYRHGASGYCAVTAEKKAVNLPATAAGAKEWRFWMQIGPIQARNGRLGFDAATAVTALVRDGFHLFTGSTALLGNCSPVDHPVNKGPANAR